MLSVAYLFHRNIIFFQDISHAHLQICHILVWVKFHRDRYQGLAFASIHEQPFPFPHNVPRWDKYMNLLRDYAKKYGYFSRINGLH